MAYFSDKRIGFSGPDKVTPPDETIDGKPHKYHPKRQTIGQRYMLGDGYYAVSGRLPRSFDVQAAVDELRAKVARSSKQSKGASGVAKVDSENA